MNLSPKLLLISFAVIAFFGPFLVLLLPLSLITPLFLVLCVSCLYLYRKDFITISFLIVPSLFGFFWLHQLIIEDTQNRVCFQIGTSYPGTTQFKHCVDTIPASEYLNTFFLAQSEI